jgi:hypothetical protein
MAFFNINNIQPNAVDLAQPPIPSAPPQPPAPPSATPAAEDKTEADGSGPKNNPAPSLVGFQDYSSYPNSAHKAPVYGGTMFNKDGSGIKPGDPLVFKKVSPDYGNSSIATAKTNSIDPKANAVARAKEIKDKQSAAGGASQKTDDPSAVSQDMSKNIHDAAMAANPQALGNVLQKALQSMVMLKMMDKLTSPAGILSMATGGLGGALQGLAGGIGLSPMMGALNSVMPQLSTSGLLTGSATDALHGGMMGMLNNTPVGALAAHEIAAAASTVSTIAGAMNAISTGNIGGAIDAVASFGGPAFGLQPGSLAAKIALVGPSGTFSTRTNVGGVNVITSITTSPIPHLTNNIPVLNGAEHVAIAALAVSDITGTLSNVLGVGNPIGAALGSVSDITSGVANLSGAFSNISNFTHGSLAGVVNGGIANIVDGGLNKILGAPLSGLIGNVSKLLPSIGPNITNSISKFGPTGMNLGKMQNVMQNATKAMALSKAAHNVAQNIFGQARAEAIADAMGAVTGLAAKVGGAISLVTAFGDKVTATVEGVAQSTVAPGAVVSVGNQVRAVTTEAGVVAPAGGTITMTA